MRWIVGALWIACACGPVVSAEDGETSGEDTTGGTSPTTTSTGPSTTQGSSTDPSTDPSAPTTMSTSGNPTDPSTDPSTDPTVDPSDSDSCGLFIGCHDDYGSDGGECDVWAQDCPRGEKCMPWANDGGPHWNSLRCSPDYQEAQIGDPCIVEGNYVSGVDNCALGSMCLFVDWKTNEGVCVANCQGSEANPVCDDPVALCAIDFDGTMINCLAPCHPLLQDCIDGGCYPSRDSFVCAPTIEIGTIAGDPCEHDWDCVPGTACLPFDLLPACEGDSCCAPFCDLEMPEQCEGLTCTPWYEEGQAPPGLEQVGVCVEG